MHQSFNSNSTSNLLATGILDSLAAGILIYVVLVQLITPCVTDSAWLHTRRWPIQVRGIAAECISPAINSRPLHAIVPPLTYYSVQVLAFVCFYAGAAAMAVVGKWA